MHSPQELEAIARRLRRRVLDMCVRGGGGHIGGSFSVMDVLVALYLNHLRLGDRVVFSKGHSCLALYAVLAEVGLLSQNDLDCYSQDNAMLGGHPKVGIPGVEVTTGSLGHGLSVAAGMAYADRATRVFCIMSDGEMNEGSTWEAVMWAAQHLLQNLTIIIDANQLELLDRTEDILDVYPLMPRLFDFGWMTDEVDGHDMKQITISLHHSRLNDCPLAIIADTVKGKGVSFMENDTKWHYRCPTKEEYDAAVKELSN